MSLGVSPQNFKTFGNCNSFWKCAKTTGLDVIDALSRDYSVSIVDLHKLKNAFWSSVSKSDAWEKLKAELAECQRPVDVTNVIKKMNGRAFGRGASKCMFVQLRAVILPQEGGITSRLTSGPSILMVSPC